MKKLLSLAVITCSVILLAGCGSKKADVSDTTTDTTVPAVTAINGKKVDASKAQCLQLVTYGMKVALAQTKGDTVTATKLANEAMEMEKKLNLDNVEYETVCGKYMTDAAFVQEVQNQVKELQK